MCSNVQHPSAVAPWTIGHNRNDDAPTGLMTHIAMQVSGVPQVRAVPIVQLRVQKVMQINAADH